MHVSSICGPNPRAQLYIPYYKLQTLINIVRRVVHLNLGVVFFQENSHQKSSHFNDAVKMHPFVKIPYHNVDSMYGMASHYNSIQNACTFLVKNSSIYHEALGTFPYGNKYKWLWKLKWIFFGLADFTQLNSNFTFLSWGGRGMTDLIECNMNAYFSLFLSPWLHSRWHFVRFWWCPNWPTIY